jgi:hypothetical protein
MTRNEFLDWAAREVADTVIRHGLKDIRSTLQFPVLAVYEQNREIWEAQKAALAADATTKRTKGKRSK